MDKAKSQRRAEPRSKRKPKGSGSERRSEILNAARELFASEGFARVTTRALAEKAGLSQTGLYIYFATKEDILRAISEETHEAMTAAFERSVIDGDTPRENLRRLTRAYIEFGLSHPADYQLTFTVSPEALGPLKKDFSIPSQRQEPGARSFMRFAELLDDACGPELLGELEPLVVTQILWFIGHGAVSLLISRPDFPWADRETLIDGLEALVLNGVFGRAVA
ncbi:MAG TPA: TetR/AcrR family transcriptional regulator [Caulobacteraceae bacterium]|nr:TetR/AcrR family transcriptional regulator [Caulobacteraceae bacterium]